MQVRNPVLDKLTVPGRTVNTHRIATHDDHCLKKCHGVIKSLESPVILAWVTSVFIAPESNKSNWKIDGGENAPFVSLDSSGISFTVILWHGIDP